MTAALLQQLRTTFLGDNERNHTWTGGMRAYRAFLEVLRGRFESRGTPSTDRTDAATYKSRRDAVCGRGRVGTHVASLVKRGSPAGRQSY